MLTGSSGFVDALNRDIFANRYSQVTGDAGAVYKDVLSKVFNCETAGAELHVGDLRGIQGEITLWLGDNKDKPFGLINVGDDGALLKLCEQQGFDRQTDQQTNDQERAGQCCHFATSFHRDVSFPAKACQLP